MLERLQYMKFAFILGSRYMYKHRLFLFKKSPSPFVLVTFLLLGPNIGHSEVKGGNVYFSSQFIDVSVHSQFIARRGGTAEKKQFMAWKQPGFLHLFIPARLQVYWLVLHTTRVSLLSSVSPSFTLATMLNQSVH